MSQLFNHICQPGTLKAVPVPVKEIAKHVSFLPRHDVFIHLDEKPQMVAKS